MTITELSIKRPTLVVVVFAVLGVLGLFSYTQLKYELLPKMSIPVVTVTTVYPGASPYEVENNVSKIIEDAVSGIDKIDNVRSMSFESMSLVIIEFKQDAVIDYVVRMRREKLMLFLPSFRSMQNSRQFQRLPLMRFRYCEWV